MPGPRVARAGQLAAELTGAGIPATADPQKLTGILPGVLVPPPRLAFDVGVGTTATWRLLVVGSSSDPLRSWEQIDPLVSSVAARLPVEFADPASFAASPGEDPLPAYALTFTEYVD